MLTDHASEPPRKGGYYDTEEFKPRILDFLFLFHS